MFIVVSAGINEWVGSGRDSPVIDILQTTTLKHGVTYYNIKIKLISQKVAKESLTKSSYFSKRSHSYKKSAQLGIVFMYTYSW